MFRLVRGPEGEVVVDLLGRAPGRGVYLRADELGEALGSRAILSRAFRAPTDARSKDGVRAALTSLRDQLETRALELLGLARRAGALTVGMDATGALLGRGRPVVVIVARDLSERSRRKIETGGSSALRTLSTMDRIGAALGRDAVGIAAVDHGKLGPSLVEVLDKLDAVERSVEQLSGVPEVARKND